MHTEPLRVIMAVENETLRGALLSALAPLACSPEVILPDALLQTELSGDVIIFLETSDDGERLVVTAQEVWEKWVESGRAFVQFVSYSSRKFTPDSLVFRLWSIGPPEGTVLVTVWKPANLQEIQMTAYTVTRRMLEWLSTSEGE